ncbi:MAG: UvrD-helicase domain-containing protein [bacterium]
MSNRIGQPDTETDINLRHRLDSSESRHFIMVAGAGSGKTTSLVKALDYIKQSQEKVFRNSGRKIACITFTEVAVGEIFDDIGSDPLFHVSTIHSFLWAVVKPFQNDIRQWVITRLHQKIEEERGRIARPRTRQATKTKALDNIEHYQCQLESIHTVKRFRYGTGSDYLNGVLGHTDILCIGAELITQSSLMRSLLVRRFPVIFIDESQDTDPEFVNALRLVAREVQQGFCLGFFGDPVQKIYMQGAGVIPVEDGWKIFNKPENFRCSQAVLKVINRIRRYADGLIQTRGRSIEGTARVVIVPSDDYRQENLHKVRLWLAEQDSDNKWVAEEEYERAFRMLVLVHRIAASSLGFSTLYSALNDKAPENLKSGLVDGTAWVLRPFLNYILPLVLARNEGYEFVVMRLLRKHCPMLSEDALSSTNAGEILGQLQHDIMGLVDMLEPNSDAQIGDIVSFLHDRQLFAYDDRYLELIESYRNSEPVVRPFSHNAILRFMQCPSKELWGYRKYIEKLSPFATQQGIKGAEFDKVLVVTDDAERALPGYSYGKYFGVIPLSPTDEKNIEEGNDSVIDRTMRLFYVCCSRALSDLAVVIFTGDVERMRLAIERKRFFDRNSVYICDEGIIRRPP